MPALVADDSIAFLLTLEILGFSTAWALGVKTQDC